MGEVRSSGHYAVIDGREVKVVSGRDHVWVPDEHGRKVRVEMSDLDDLLSVGTRATWRGAEIAIGTVEGEECGFYTNSGDLAEAEGLHGDFYNGWTGVARLDELSDVRERSTSIHPDRRRA